VECDSITSNCDVARDEQDRGERVQRHSKIWAKRRSWQADHGFLWRLDDILLQARLYAIREGIAPALQKCINNQAHQNKWQIEDCGLHKTECGGVGQ